MVCATGDGLSSLNPSATADSGDNTTGVTRTIRTLLSFSPTGRPKRRHVHRRGVHVRQRHVRAAPDAPVLLGWGRGVGGRGRGGGGRKRRRRLSRCRGT